jgi:hypothetical protein
LRALSISASILTAIIMIGIPKSNNKLIIMSIQNSEHNVNWQNIKLEMETPTMMQ